MYTLLKFISYGNALNEKKIVVSTLLQIVRYSIKRLNIIIHEMSKLNIVCNIYSTVIVHCACTIYYIIIRYYFVINVWMRWHAMSHIPINIYPERIWIRIAM